MGDDDDSLVDDADERSPGLVWSLASFHASFFVALAVTLGYLFAPLGDLLGGLRTSVGLGLYLVLWATTWLTNRRWVEEIDLMGTAREGRRSGTVTAGARWGGVNGTTFLGVTLLLAGFAALAETGGRGASIELVGIVLLVAAVGSVVAFAVGALVGGLFAALDAIFVRLSVRLSERMAGRPSTTAERRGDQ